MNITETNKDCDICNKSSKLKYNQYTHEQFLDKLRIVNPDVVVLDIYSNMSTRILCRCSICGNEWKAWPQSLLDGHKCKRCATNEVHERQLIPHEDFVTHVASISPNIKILGKYRGYHEKIDCECTVCGYKWSPYPSVILRDDDKSHCPFCSKHIHNKTTAFFISEVANVKPNIEILGEYTGANEHIKCRCKVCGYIWNPTASSLINGDNGCPGCSRTSTSVVEQAIYYSFCAYFGGDNVLSRDKTLIGKELDIVVPNERLAIEYGSWYWHKDKLDNDELKRTLCSNINVRCITIYDDCNEIFDDVNVIVYENYMGDSNEHLIKVISNLFTICHLDYTVIQNDILDILLIAREKSLRWSNQRFRDELNKVKPNIEVLDDYIDSKTAIRFKCKDCGHVWSRKTPLDLLNGTCGCPKCAAKLRGLSRRKSHDEFISEVNSINPNIEVLGTYIKKEVHIDCRCRICGHEWSPIAGSLIRGLGCPACGRERTRKSKYKPVINLDTNEVFSSLNDAAESCGLADGYTISRVCKGLAQTAGGYHWRYVDEEE